MANSGYDPVFLKAWQNEDNDSIDAVVAELNGPPVEGQKPEWDKKAAQKEAARYRKEGVNLRKFGKQRVFAKINADEANKFLASLSAPAPAEEGEGEEAAS